MNYHWIYKKYCWIKYAIQITIISLNNSITYSQIINSDSPSSQIFINSNTVLENRGQVQLNIPMGGNAKSIDNMVKQVMTRGPIYTPGMTPQEIQQANLQHIQNEMAKSTSHSSTGSTFYQSKKEQQIHDLKTLLNQEKETLPKISSITNERSQKTIYYKTAFEEILRLHDSNEKDALKQVIFLIENAYSDNSLSYVQYSKDIAQKVLLLQNLMKKESISDDDML
jgi:hypothetical protein